MPCRSTSRFWKTHRPSFWIKFSIFFIPSLFISVWPLYKGSIFIWVALIWAVFASIIAAPEYLAFALPVALLHSATCYTVARLISNRFGEQTTLSSAFGYRKLPQSAVQIRLTWTSHTRPGDQTFITASKLDSILTYLFSPALNSIRWGTRSLVNRRPLNRGC